MKAVILAGGFGTRISEESGVRPKPMVEIGGKPVLWHIMKIYSSHGINDFVICCGYKGYVIKEYFSNYFLHMADITFDLEKNEMEIHRKNSEPWKVTLVDTGEGTMTGGRIKRVADYVKDETFCLTYGDGVSDVNISASIAFHQKQKTLVTLTAVQQPGRFGIFTLGDESTRIESFKEKPRGGGFENAWINGGFFVVEPEALNFISDDQTVWEKEPLEKLAEIGQLSAFKHFGFWHPMDTLRDKQVLESLCNANKAPWKIW
ncbi:MAG: glucose-1-phosphate cytidylyltransferase [Algoriphagus sp.]|jgi:glucose-1-phosphate cytidylyltransferase|uniref:glucose-1-phosphate cytidylyltransferase n=1 Tax=Algoriphagus sp. TaxID=1872435 RepID=UPI002607F1CC|nr:glucose-1-phosphate cytidylyltransferase [Algoriphagus sp.]MDG1279237.1 glucose-1-phosphate cytidylyltransferase [Algoriphagus sp.]